MNAFDPAQIYKAFDNQDAYEFRRLLSAHPELLRNDDGRDYWMQSAAQVGWLEGVKVLHELGIGVNERPSTAGDEVNDPDDPFLQLEGPILMAAANGQLEVVRWLLDHGAQINFTVKDRPRCLSIDFAAQNGHLDVIKLLVERGGYFDATNHGVNAISLAEDHGQWEVFDYLHALGARTLRETTKPDYDRTHRRIRGTMRENLGPLSDWKDSVPGEPPIEICLIPANENSSVHTLFTVGLSDHPLPRGRWKQTCCELKVMLPADWPTGDEPRSSIDHAWPLEWLKKIAGELRQADRMPDEPILFMNGEPPKGLAEETELCGWLLMQALGESIDAPDYRYVGIYAIFPIYTDEAAYAREHGSDALAREFYSRDVPLHVVTERMNVVKQ